MGTIYYREQEFRENDPRIKLVSWVGMRAGDSAQPCPCALYQDKSIQVCGQFGEGSLVQILGSNAYEPREDEWALLRNALGVGLRYAESIIHETRERVSYIRPDLVESSSGTRLSVHLLLSSFGWR